MEHITQSIELESAQFPFRIFEAYGMSEENAYLHNHDCLEINYVVDGTGTYLIGENEYPIQKGDLFLMNNCEYHIALRKDGLVLKVIVFNPDMIWQNNSAFDYKYLQTFFEWKTSFKHRFPAENKMVEQIAGIFGEIEEEWTQKQEGYRLMIKALLLQMLSLLYRGFALSEENSQKVLQFQVDYNKIVDAVVYIDEHYQSHISLSFLSELTHLSPNYFSTLFHQVMSVSVSGYINQKRISHACLLLKTTGLNVTEIAFQSGFNSVSHFNKVFKSLEQLSPKQYREKFKL